MSDILNKIVAVKHEEIALALPASHWPCCVKMPKAAC
jgi:hypothetical protein